MPIYRNIHFVVRLHNIKARAMMNHGAQAHRACISARECTNDCISILHQSACDDESWPMARKRTEHAFLRASAQATAFQSACDDDHGGMARKRAEYAFLRASAWATAFPLLYHKPQAAVDKELSRTSSGHGKCPSAAFPHWRRRPSNSYANLDSDTGRSTTNVNYRVMRT